MRYFGIEIKKIVGLDLGSKVQGVKIELEVLVDFPFLGFL